MERRTLLLIASILVAALGTALIWLYVQGADQRARSSQDLVTVYVLPQAVDAGTPGATVRQSVIAKRFSRESVAELQLVTDLDELSKLRAKQRISAGLPLLTSQFDATGAAPTSPAQPDAGKVAMSVQLGDPQRVAGLLKPGSRVLVFATRKPIESNASLQALVLLTNVKVLAADGATAGAVQVPTQRQATGAAAVPKALVTLELTPRDAGRVALTQSQLSPVGELYFALQGERVTIQRGDTIGVDELAVAD